MAWSGNIAGMGQLAQRMRDLASVPARSARKVAGRLQELLEDEFSAGADPYGNAWEPLAPVTLEKRSQTHEPPLTDYGEMRASLLVKPLSGAGVGVTIDHPAEDHQTGWKGSQGEGPARPILPAGRMPALWREAIEDAVQGEVSR